MSTTDSRTDAAFRSSADDYSTARLPESKTQSTWDISLVRMGLTVSSSDLIFGYTIGLYFGFWQAILISLLISVVVALISIGIGFIGLRERVTFALASRFAFGRQGSRLPSLIMAVVIAVFFGYILGITVNVFPGATTPVGEWAYSIVLGAVFVTISLLGFARGLRWMARIGVPLMIVLVVVADVLTIVHVGGFGAIVHAKPAMAGQMAVAAILAAGISKWMAGATISADITRFGRGPSSVWITTTAEFLLGNFGFNFLGLILGLGLRSSDLGAAFGLIGLTWLATVTFFIQGVTVESNELYAASLSTTNAIGLPRTWTTIIVGAIGIVISIVGLTQGIIASFLTFTGYLGYVLPVIPSIMLADYFIVHRARYRARLGELPAVNWRAVAALVVTVALNLVLGLVLHDALWHALPLFGGIIYLVFSLPLLVRGGSRGAPTETTAD